jgi:hypothetical protein
VGKGAKRRAHHLRRDFVRKGGHASLCPPFDFLFEINHRSTVHGVVFENLAISDKKKAACVVGQNTFMTLLRPSP